MPLFYLLFLPITWVAVSSGLEGVSVALVVTQVGLFGALQFSSERMKDITNMQARMLVLAVTGLAAGAVVTERRHAEQQLRQNQAAIARLSRLGSMGELAAAIAHEVNQPLSAAGTYSRLVTDSLASETLSDPSIVQTAQKATAQVERAAAVIRRLRALVRIGRSDMSAVGIAKIIQEALDLVGPVLDRSNIGVDIEVESGLPPVMADRIQIEQVLVNLLRNSAEAMAGAPGNCNRISLRAIKTGARHIEIRVCDTGPGFPAEFCGAVPPLFSSNKADGLGVGLSLCRSIAEAHGGTIRVMSGKNGATVSFTLRLAEGIET
jgi:C4-dicarboxylate-specific signal transduction histidine kinase